MPGAGDRSSPRCSGAALEEWAEGRNHWLFAAGLVAFGALFAVYAVSLKVAELSNGKWLLVGLILTGARPVYVAAALDRHPPARLVTLVSPSTTGWRPTWPGWWPREARSPAAAA